MSSDFSRRSFLATSTAASATAWLAGCPVPAPPPKPPGNPSPGHALSPGGQSEESGQAFIAGAWRTVLWTRRGGDFRLEVTRLGVAISLPTMTPALLSIADVQRGIGHDDIRTHFGDPTLARVLDALAA